MTAATKNCAACDKPFGRTNRISTHRWERQLCCSQACAIVYRKQRPGGDHDVAQSRERSKRAMNAHWHLRQAIAANKAKSEVSAHASREAEEAAIARWLAKNQPTRGDPAGQEFIEGRHGMHRPQPMAGWRG